MDAQKAKAQRAERRQFRVRNNLLGTAEKPRLSVARTNLHIYAQLIDDVNGVTLAAAASNGKDLKLAYGGNVKAAGEVGRKIAEKAKAIGITAAQFDRGPYRFHGRIEALARAATEGGLVCTGLEARVKKEAAVAAPVKPVKDKAAAAEAAAAGKAAKAARAAKEKAAK